MKKKMRLTIVFSMLLTCTTIIAQDWTIGGNTLGTTGDFGSIDNKKIDFISHNKKRGRLTNDGLWGFGTTSPLAQVHINSTDSSRNAFQIDVLDVPKIVVTKSGRVGVGITIPDAKLHVTNGTDVSLADGGFLEVGLTTATNLAMDGNEIIARNNGTAGTLFLNKDGGDVNISSGGLFLKGSNDFVGIGNTTPKARLHVTGGTDVSLSGGGTIVAGLFQGDNLAIDNNEIQARNNGASATLSLNAEGGLVQTGADLKVPGEIFLGNDASFTGGNFRVITNGSIVPNFDGGWELGTSLAKWMDVWATDGTINTSDERDKTNIKDLNYGLKEIMKLRSVRFNWKNKIENGEKLGLIAQELQKVLPEVVRDFEYKTDRQTGKKEKIPAVRLGVMYADIIPVLIRGIQQQQEIVNSQQKKLNEQDEKIEELSKRINQLAEALPATGKTAKNINDFGDKAFLKQNAPNPFSENTVINYYLPQNAGRAFINITDLNGRVIKTIAATAKGNGELVIQGGQLPSGTYQYSLFMDGKLIDSKKMLLLK